MLEIGVKNISLKESIEKFQSTQIDLECYQNLENVNNIS